MRPDFNKLLTERERIGHRASFHDVRNCKDNANFTEDSQGGKVSIHSHRRSAVKVSRKQFNENLNPLKGYLRSRIGKSWDKTYSEIRSTFDARKVVNNHILEHLFQYVELNVKIIDGKPVVLNLYTQVYESVSKGYNEYYVDPRDGVMKKTNRKTRRQRTDERAQQRAAELLKVKRVIDQYHELHKIEGIWFLITIKDIPAAVPMLTKPLDIDTATWLTLSAEERVKQGVTKYVVPTYNTVKGLLDEFTLYDYRSLTAQRRYYALKQSAPAKLLREHGLAGDAEYTERPRSR